MSNFASHPYHTVSAVHAFGHVTPLSPPGTDQVSPHAPHGASSFLAAGAELDRNSRATPPRRTTVLSYQNSSARDLRDRNYARGSRSLVVVIPPPDFPLDQGQLGNVLSMGPRHRLSQGILMPLFTSVSHSAFSVCDNSRFPDVWTTQCDCSRVQLPKHRRDLPLPSLLRKWHYYDAPHLR